MTSESLGDILVQENIISDEQLQTALQDQKKTGLMLGMTLIKLGYLDGESSFMPALAEQFRTEFVRLKDLNIDKSVINKIPAKFSIYYKVIPVFFEEGVLTIATTNPLNIEVQDGLHHICSDKIKFVLAPEKEILESVRQYYGVGAETIDQMMEAVQVAHQEKKDIQDIEEIDSEASIGKFINQILLEAYKKRATDIHIEPFEQDLKIRYRVDGVLYDTQVPANIWHFRDSINTRIKIMSNLNIAEKRLPQDGRFKVRVGDIDLDLRISFLPTPYGESVVIRILSSTTLLGMKELGVSANQQKKLHELLKKPHGIIFVTGPTGSGKTTSLYTCLSHVNREDKKIITIEDPIEYQLKGITQIQINPHIGLSFASGLRSMLRHDPDIMMVGEVRDVETAEIAIQIALTGHLVLSTLHTNDAASGVTRLIDMGVEPYLISSSVECFVAQRLVRIICPHCKVKVSMNPEHRMALGVKESQAKDVSVYKGEGCEACNFTGYHGREGIYEFLFLSDKVKELVSSRASSVQIKNEAISRGMKTLLQHGWEKIQKGITTSDEVLRVTKEDYLQE